MESIKVAVPCPTGTCVCGCGERTNAGRYFRPGHDHKLATRVIRKFYRATGADAARSGAETVAFALAHDHSLEGEPCE